MQASPSPKKIAQSTDKRISKVPAANSSEYIVFDADRDNKGKGVKAKEFLKILKKINI